MQLFNRFLISLCLLAILQSSLNGQDSGKRSRVALVIGNSRYEPHIGPLRNTVNDARAISRAVRALGFEVTEKHNVTRDELLTALGRFRERARSAEVSLFYFAGHGVSVSGANYLLPIKSGYRPQTTDPTSLRMLAETKLFNAEQAVAEMSNAGTGCNLVILDACRSTPVAKNPANRSATTEGGLVEMNPPAGSLVAFSTDAGSVASDGEGKNGLYTAELVKHLLTRGITVEQVFKRTRASVIALSNGAQVPAEYSRLVGDDVYLAGKPSEESTGLEAPKAQPIPLPSLTDINKLAARGDAEKCTHALRQHARWETKIDSAAPLSILLEGVKDALRDPAGARPHLETLLVTCDRVIEATAEFIPAGHATRAVLLGKAHNRRGDILLLLDRPEEALAAFETALTFTSNDAYVVYNRGVALLRLGRTDEARKDFQKAADPKNQQAGARKLAVKALGTLEAR